MPDIILTNISKSYGDKSILKDFSLTVKENSICIITGDSGCGKTTLLRIISGLDTDYTGEIVGISPSDCAFVFQEYRLFPWLSAIDNVIFAISDRKDEAVYKKAYDMLLTLGFSENDMNLTPSELSGGMKQRVSIARAMLFDRPILLLDEPTKELDPVNSDIVRSLIIEESRRRLVILVTHRQEDVSLLNAEEILL